MTRINSAVDQVVTSTFTTVETCLHTLVESLIDTALAGLSKDAIGACVLTELDEVFQLYCERLLTLQQNAIEEINLATTEAYDAFDKHAFRTSRYKLDASMTKLGEAEWSLDQQCTNVINAIALA